MTVSQLRKALKGLNGKMPVYLADHDHGTYQQNGALGSAEVVDQREMREWERQQLDESHVVKRKYLVLRVG